MPLLFHWLVSVSLLAFGLPFVHFANCIKMGFALQRIMFPFHCILRRQIFIMFILVPCRIPVWRICFHSPNNATTRFAFFSFLHYQNVKCSHMPVSHMSICQGNLFNFIARATHSTTFYAYFDLSSEFAETVLHQIQFYWNILNARMKKKMCAAKFDDRKCEFLPAWWWLRASAK